MSSLQNVFSFACDSWTNFESGGQALAYDYEMCQKFLRDDSNRIVSNLFFGLYHKYFENGVEDPDECLVFKYDSNQLWKMSIGLDDSRNVKIGVSDKSDEWTDANDVFSLDVNHHIWNCSVKQDQSDGQIPIHRVHCSRPTEYQTSSEANLIKKGFLVFHPIPHNSSLVIAMNRIGTTFGQIEISTEIRITGELCSDVQHICLLKMDSKMREKFQSIVAYYRANRKLAAER